jgi:hypothetical protein
VGDKLVGKLVRRIRDDALDSDARLQRAARRLLDLAPIISTQSVMQWAYRDCGTLRQRWLRARAARRACASLVWSWSVASGLTATFGHFQMTVEKIHSRIGNRLRGIMLRGNALHGVVS